jgi:hypothetical protein
MLRPTRKALEVSSMQIDATHEKSRPIPQDRSAKRATHVRAHTRVSVQP